MGNLTKDTIESMLRVSSNLDKTISQIKSELLAEGYKDYSYDKKLFLIKGLGNRATSVSIDMTPFIKDKHMDNKVDEEGIEKNIQKLLKKTPHIAI
jgi:hypothetical protein